MAEGTDCVCCGKESFWSAKGLHLGGKRSPFGKHADSCLTEVSQSKVVKKFSYLTGNIALSQNKAVPLHPI